MSDKSKNSKQPLDPARPFDRAVLAEARRIAEDYEITLWFEDGRWYGHGLELPNVYGDGRTPDAAVADTREALVTAAATLIEMGQRPPAPARAGARTEQINVRLSAEERALLENRSRAGGFRGISDYVRATALQEGEAVPPASGRRAASPAKTPRRPARTKGGRR